MSIFEIVILSFPLGIVLLSVAFMPLIAPKFWHKYEAALLSIVSIISLILTYKVIPSANKIIKQALLDDYVPFIVMISTLYILSDGIRIKLTSSASSMANIIFLGCSSLFSSFIGTTGASILFLPSFLEMNKNRSHKWHLVIFFIFLVANIGGMLTPLGDAPLLMGYLHGVDFSWSLVNLFPYWLIYIICCLCMLYAIDRIMLKKEDSLHFLTKQKFSIKVSGGGNIILLMLTIFVLFINFKHELFVPQIFIKSAILLLFSGISIYFRKGKHINFAPCIEVAQTFLAIFIVIAPVLFILNENTESIHNYIERMSHGSTSIPLYFWIGSITSSFLDNAPSYLLLFNIVGGNAESLMYIHSNILTAISVSTVVMGAMTYIGNAPNLMIRSIVQRNGIKMPSFIGYMALSCLIILPISFIVVFLIS